MRKRILSIALVLCMVLAVLPTAVIVLAATPTGTALTQSNISSYTNLTGGSTESEMAYYYLAENVNVPEALTVTGYVTLDLNGKTLSMSPGVLCSTLIIGTESTSGYLTISDSQGSGQVTTSNGLYYCVQVLNGSLTLNSGKIKAVYLCIKVEKNAVMTMNGGTLEWAIDDSTGFRNYGTFYTHGGKFLGWITNETGGKITHEENVTTAITYEEMSTVSNYGELGWGIYTDMINQPGAVITGGTFDKFTSSNYGTINGGTFNVKVINYDKINGGIFNDEVVNEGSGTITGGLFKTAPSGYETWNVTFVPENGEEETTYKAIKNTTITPLTTPVKDGYTFVGWYEKDANGALKDTAFDFANTKVTGDITLYAKWVCIHSGGTADCTHKAKCEVCGEEYGSTNPDKS